MTTRRIPLFPLNVVLFPGMPLPLHIFEPRYQEMIRDCMAADRLFGVCLIRSGQEVDGPADPHAVGTTCEILESKALGGGRLNLATVGRERFRIRRLIQERAYLEGEVELLPDEEPAIEALRPLVAEAQEAAALYVYGLLELAGEEPKKLELRLPDDAAGLANVIGSLLQVDAPLRQELLEMDAVEDRLRRGLELLREQVDQNAALQEAEEREIRPYRVDASRLSMN